MLNSLHSTAITNSTVVVRTDYNVPMDGIEIADHSRILQSLPTIKLLLEKSNTVVILSHLGRPGGIDKTCSLRPIADYLRKILPNIKVHFFEESIYNAKPFLEKNVKPGDICLLENIRFYPEEETCDPSFSKLLASLGDIFINDAFSVSHRKHASVYGISQHLPSYSGFSLQREVEEIDNFLAESESPKTCIIGGAKVSTKLPLIKNLISKVDIMVCGGAIGVSFAIEKYCKNRKFYNKNQYSDEINFALKFAEENGVDLICPVDFVGLLDEKIVHLDAETDNLEGAFIYDIGQKSVEEIKTKIFNSKTVLWNGPVGKFEDDDFAYGTKCIAEIVTDATSRGIVRSIVGGGDTFAAINKFMCADKVSYASTSGGAFLEYLEGKQLPGILAVSTKTT